MSNNSRIEWTEATWNPVTGCTEVSPGCDHCYARAFAERFRGVLHHPYEQGFDVKLWPQRLMLPATWKRPRMIFVNSMSDLFHQLVPDDFIVDVFVTMAYHAPHHTYQVLTKRPSRLVNTALLARVLDRVGNWPPHIWMGVSVEQNAYTWRVEKLRAIPAPIRFISAEPLLDALTLDLTGISWVIAGAESGHGARPMQETWVRHLRDQCLDQHVAFFYKQNAVKGRKVPLPPLDGVVWRQMPSLAVW
ncbi:MAG: phage Gp37/Gp68 family protein [Ktedonobacteraceae bacterium]|nr:phage Gp37/Gp68 family protein [Ktedonobacteraceae bacterium]